MSKQDSVNTNPKTSNDTHVSIFGQPDKHGDKIKQNEAEKEAAKAAERQERQAKEDARMDKVKQLRGERNRLEAKVTSWKNLRSRAEDRVGQGTPQEQNLVQQRILASDTKIKSLTEELNGVTEELERVYEERV